MTASSAGYQTGWRGERKATSTRPVAEAAIVLPEIMIIPSVECTDLPSRGARVANRCWRVMAMDNPSVVI